jgi:hypothetical protein
MLEKVITIKRKQKEIDADKRAAKRLGLSVHAWRRLALNLANGLANPGALARKVD